jgi:hypothetical protein
MNHTLSLKTLTAYRAQMFRLQKNKKLKTVDDALEFVNERGFVFFWPIKGIVLPSLWAGVAGDRPVADKHDDPAHVTWGWKDAMLSERKWYYAKVLRHKATMISLKVAPYFYALTENFGDPEQDYLLQHEQGLLSREAKTIYEALLTKGALHTIDLRRKTRLTSKDSDTRFNRALEQLQGDFKILPVGVAKAGAWKYAFIYDTVHHHYPKLIEQAGKVSRKEARAKLLELYLKSVGAFTQREAHKLFGWQPKELEAALADLTAKGVAASAEVKGDKEKWLTLKELI